MNISVILCTFNRCQSLSKALESVAAQALPESAGWEVIVVDNNSSDQTRDVAERFCHEHPEQFRYVFEPQQGKSNALNRGIREARGDILAFMDDDVTVEPDWLCNITAPLLHSDLAGVGGRIVPPSDFSPPSWLALAGPYDLGGILALFDKGREGADLTEAPFGTNMAFRKQMFEKYGLFRSDLGPTPGSEIRGEDTEFGRRVLKGGDRLWYEPSAIVHHAVPEHRLQKGYFLRFQFDQGRATIREKGRRPTIWFLLSIVSRPLRSRTIGWFSRSRSAAKISKQVYGLDDAWPDRRNPAFEFTHRNPRWQDSCQHGKRQTKSRMKVSIILCTYNRCHSLATALESVAVSQLPESLSWEVLVVDNNSKDKTRDVVQEFAHRFPCRFRYLFEPQQGKSYALNSGIREAQGEILAFIDDDVVADGNWLQALITPLQRQEWAGVGGRILPERTFKPPDWLSLDEKYALAPLAIFDIGAVSGEMVEAPFGTNMAFRKEVFEQLGGFRTDLGPRPGSEIRNEDTELGFRALGAGRRLWYEPSAIVYHSLSEQRLQKSYFLTWWHDKARTEIRVHGVPSGVKICGVPLFYFRRLANWTLQWIVSINPARRFSCKRKMRMIVGNITECYRLSAKAKDDGGNTAHDHA